MKIDPQYWEDAQEALNRIFDRCEEIDPQSGYDMLEDIQFVRGFIDKHTNEDGTLDDDITCILEDVPSVTQKTGRWIFNGYYECSECGKTTYNDTYKYCPNCGAKMKGAEE